MKRVNRESAGRAAGTAAAVFGGILLAVLACAPAAFAQGAQTAAGTPVANVPKTAAVTAFEKRVQDYADMREAIEEKMPKLSKDAKPEEIERHKAAFQAAVRAARAGAKRGDLFLADVVGHIRAQVNSEFQGREGAALKKTYLVEADVKGVPLRVNYPYPEAKEQVEMPPTLLLKLPQLPKQVRYRFVGRHLLLVDRENGLIVDYMTDAIR
jgi:hypothetical protein